MKQLKGNKADKFANILLLIIGLMFVDTCNSYNDKRDYSLISVASFPVTINTLKDRWLFCEKCLNGSACEQEDIKQCKNVTLKDRGEALSLAVGRANKEAVYFLVNVAKTDVNGVTGGEYPETPLMIAAYYGTQEHQEIAKFLISRGADINKTTTPTPVGTVLLTAIWKNNLEFSKFSLKNGADPSVTASGRKEGYVCKYAIQKKQAEVIPYIPNCCSITEQNPNWFREAGYLCP